MMTSEKIKEAVNALKNHDCIESVDAVYNSGALGVVAVAVSYRKGTSPTWSIENVTLANLGIFGEVVGCFGGPNLVFLSEERKFLEIGIGCTRYPNALGAVKASMD